MTGYSIKHFQKGEPCLIVLESHDHYLPNIWQGEVFTFWDRYYYRLEVLVTDEAVRDNPDPEINQYYGKLAPGDYFVYRADNKLMIKKREQQLERSRDLRQHQELLHSDSTNRFYGFAADVYKEHLQVGSACWLELATSYMTAPNTVRGRVTEQKELDGILAVRAIVTDKHIGEHEDPRIHELHGHEPTVFYEVSPVRGLTRLTIIQFVSYYIECLANWLTKLERKIRELRIQMGNKLP